MPQTRPTLRLVAEEAGVSLMTASYAYNQPDRVSETSRAKVLAAAAELGYAGPDPRARSLRRGSALTLGVVLGEHLSYAFDDPGAAAFLGGVADVCAGAGFGMTILPVTGAPDDLPRLADAAVDGFVVWTTSEDDPVLDAIAATRRPAVVHGGPDHRHLGLVTIDNRAAAREVAVLAFAGATRPSVVSQPLDRARSRRVLRGPDPSDVLFPVTRDRLAGFRDAAVEVGLDWRDVVVGVCSRNGVTEAEEMATTLFSAPEPPDAIAAMGDLQAAGVVRAARAAGLTVGVDLALSGWDDLPVAADLDLTTVAQSLRDQGATCARLALGQEAGATASWRVVQRGSTERDRRAPRNSNPEPSDP
jgi:DNA-binding LacI/PurR family transcriptional regulator